MPKKKPNVPKEETLEDIFTADTNRRAKKKDGGNRNKDVRPTPTRTKAATGGHTKRTPAPKKKQPAKKTIAPVKKAPPKKSPSTKRPKPLLDALLPDQTSLSSLSEVSGAADLDISNPIPRVAPIDPSKSLDPIERLLNIKWNRFIPQVPTKKQVAAMMLAHIKELMFGGALGGGKSSWLGMEALRYCDLPGFSAIIFRRQLTDLKQPGGLIPRLAQWLEPFRSNNECRYSGDEHTWFFKTTYPGTDIPGPEARLQFGYIGEASIRDRYSSAEYQLVEFEELWQWPEPTDYLFMRSRIRKCVCVIHGKLPNGDPNYVEGCPYCDTYKAMPLRMRAATNPGPAWIKRRFGIIPDPTQFPNRHAALIAISEGHKVRWVGTNPERPFIPSYLDDNPHLDGKDYRDMLKEMTEEERSRLEDGNWEARKNSRFKRRWQKFYRLHVPDAMLSMEPPVYTYPENGKPEPIYYDLSQCSYSYVETDRFNNQVVFDPVPLTALRKIYTTVDPAVTVRQGPVDEQVKQKNSAAVISTWGLTQENLLLWLHMRKFRKEIPDLVEQLVDNSSIWRPQYNKIECNGVGIGVAQYAEAAGLPVTKNYRKSDKLENSLSAQILMKNGRILFPDNALWLEEAEDDTFSWTGLPTEDDDVIDTLSDAATDISTTVAHEISAPNIVRGRPLAVSMATSHSYGVPRWGFK